ncbi:MAG: PEP-CTERM sorting domain-containing protein [Cytophagales bacterium]|nr:PEP-CTERM sorting domain-containing protein [Armatimonadota bacterium]
MFFRWVDDNSAFSSPDHMYGLDNIRVTGISSGTAAPEPGTLGFLAIGLVAFAARRRR